MRTLRFLALAAGLLAACDQPNTDGITDLSNRIKFLEGRLDIVNAECSHPLTGEWQNPITVNAGDPGFRCRGLNIESAVLEFDGLQPVVCHASDTAVLEVTTDCLVTPLAVGTADVVLATDLNDSATVAVTVN